MKQTILTIYRLLASIATLLLVIYFALDIFGIHSSALGNSISNLLESFLSPIRGVVPSVFGIDFSPLILILLLSVIDWLLRSLWSKEPIN